MEIVAPKALYNALRIGQLLSPNQNIAFWKVEDLRKVSEQELFKRLMQHDILLDRLSFSAYADAYDCPEELAIALLPEHVLGTESADKVYLVIFELWRRNLPEKPSISLIADELDFQIFCYDSDTLETFEPLDDALASITQVLEENVDKGLSRTKAFSLLSQYVAHDITVFLYDYISDLIDNGLRLYAKELLEHFYPFVLDKKWFELILARLEPHTSVERIKRILKETESAPNLDLNIDILTELVHANEPELFHLVAKKTIPILEDTSDFDEFVNVSLAFFSEQENEDKVVKLQGLVASHALSKEKLLDFYSLDAEKISRSGSQSGFKNQQI